MRTINKWVALTIVLSALIVTPAVVFGAVTDTAIDYGAGIIYVHGDSFGTKVGTVQIGKTALTVLSWQPGEIIASLPPGITAGTYSMTVIDNSGQKTTQDVTITAAISQRRPEEPEWVSQWEWYRDVSRDDPALKGH
ncbi:MAG: IPT/TIG domain-containing protein [Syntrophobacteraceae bacterium]